jgi:Permuted papain-like amidase enzyme, YaeF/YiiX, C92 family
MNLRFPLIFLFVSFLCAALSSAQETAPERRPLSPEKWSKLQPGDIVFIRSRTANAPLIAALSNVDGKSDADDVFTHCGIIFKDNDNQLKVYEGEGRGAGHWLTLAEWQREESKGKVNGVAKTDLHNVYALRWNGQPTLATGLANLLERAKELHDTGYDCGFSWSDKYAYCSELVWKAYTAGNLSLGTLPTMGKYVNAVSPDVAQEIKHKLEEAKGKYRDKGYVADESAVSPEDIFRSSSVTPVTNDSP